MPDPKQLSRSILARIGVSTVLSIALAPLALFVIALVVVAGTLALGTSLVPVGIMPAALMMALPLVLCVALVIHRLLWGNATA